MLEEMTTNRSTLKQSITLPRSGYNSQTHVSFLIILNSQGGGVTPSLDHSAVENAHQQAYGGGGGGGASMDAGSMGSAAAMQVGMKVKL